MKYMRRTAGYIWNDYKINAQIARELKITPILDKLLEYKRSLKHVQPGNHTVTRGCMGSFRGLLMMGTTVPEIC
jgi:hypothetical protein